MEYLVVFMNYDGKKLYEVRVTQGDTAVYEGPIPQKEGETFIGWNKSLNDINDDIIVTAIFEKAKAGTIKVGAMSFVKDNEKDITVIDNAVITNEDIKIEKQNEVER